MGRVINIDELWKELEILYDAKNGEVTWNDALWKIKRAPVVESNAQQWIPCSERLPDEGVEVLCCFRNGNNYKIIVSKRTDFNYWSSVGRTGDTIAWMPLPEPWKGEQP